MTTPTDNSALIKRKKQIDALVHKVIDTRAKVKDVGKELALFEPPTQALIIAKAFDVLELSVSATDFINESETRGRRIEYIMLEVQDVNELVSEMTQQEFVDALMSIVRGHAGEYSAVADLLTEDMLDKVYNERNMTWSRLIHITHTLICECDENNEAINAYFGENPRGRAVLKLIEKHGSTEDTEFILRYARTHRNIDTRSPSHDVEAERYAFEERFIVPEPELRSSTLENMGITLDDSDDHDQDDADEAFEGDDDDELMDDDDDLDEGWY